MGTPFQIVAGLLVLWMLVVGGLALWPESGRPDPFAAFAASRTDPQAGHSGHTGRWVVDVDAGGEAAYLREIARY